MSYLPDPRYEAARARAAEILNAYLVRQLPPIGGLPLTTWIRQDRLTFVRIRGAQAVWDEDPQMLAGERLLNTLRGLDGLAGYWHCWQLSYDASREELHILLGAPYPNVAQRIQQLHPYLQLSAPDHSLLQRTLNHRQQRLVTGVLGRHNATQQYVPQVEQLVTLNADFDWACWIFLAPRPQPMVLRLQDPLLAYQEELSPYAERTLNVGDSTARRSSGTLHRALKLIERLLERLDEGLATGLWLSNIVLTAPDDHVDLVGSTLLAAYATANPSEPLALHKVSGASQDDQRTLFGTDQLTRELAGLITIPRVERRGFRIAPYAAFDQDVAPAPAAPLLIGRVVQGMRDTSVPYQIARDALARHALVAGLTGSGKSNTCKMLVQQLVAQQTPVLIIEPAKAEYRSLQFQTYTLGNEAAHPLRLNPFELPLLYDSAGRIMFAPVQAHIDYLKAVFNSSFVLFAPMPYILERCLHEIYIDRGWDLATGLNRRALHLDHIFPTLTDLYDKIDAVVGTLGYDQRLEMDIRAGLLARIESLRIGGRGLLLDSTRSTPTIAELLARPTVLELEALGNDEEKAFVMGLILALLYQYRVLQATVQRAQGGIANENPTLQHVVVIEEAHRLLSQRPGTGGSGDHADVSGQTLSVFANMLAEVRAYGQGFVIVDQIPSRLESSVVKNTELKLIHKLVAPDDRELLAKTSNLSDVQAQFVSTLPQGYAVVHGGADDRPHLVHMAAFSGSAGALNETATLPAPLPSCATYCPAWQRQGRCPLPLRDIGRRIAARVEGQHVLGIVTAAAEGQVYVHHDAFLRRIADSARQDAPESADVVHVCATLHAVDAGLLQFERAYRNWPIEHAAELVALCVQSVQPHDRRLQTLQPLLAQALAASGPYPLCTVLCQQPCRYRLITERLLTPYRRATSGMPLGNDIVPTVAQITRKQEDKIWELRTLPAQRHFRMCLLLHLAQHFDPAHVYETVLNARDHCELHSEGGS